MQPHRPHPILPRELGLLLPALALALALSGCDHASQQELNQEVAQTQQKLVVVQHEAASAAKEVDAYSKSPQFKAFQKKGRDDIDAIQKDMSLPPAEKKRRIAHVEHETQHEIAALKLKYQALQTLWGSSAATPAPKTSTG